MGKKFNVSKLSILILVAFSVACIAGCSADRSESAKNSNMDKPILEDVTNSLSKEQIKSIEQSEVSSASIGENAVSDEAMPETSGQIDRKSGIPVMTAENQQYYDKYFRKLLRVCPFLDNFSGGDFSKTSYFPTGKIYQCLTGIIGTDAPEQEVETVVQQYFEISVEDMRRLAYTAYSSVNQSYILWNEEVMKDEPNIQGSIVESKMEDGLLVLICDWYNDNGTNPSVYTKQQTSEVRIQIESEDRWIYCSNKVIDIYDPNHYAYSEFHPNEN